MMGKRNLFRVVVFVLMLYVVGTIQAAPVGTAFTYQGQLYDVNNVADGEYDFQFKLYDSSSDANQVASDVNKPDVNVVDGYFAVELDFGSDVFDANARWLEIGVRQGALSDPNGYTTLSPRMELTPTPYAVYAAKAAAVPGGSANYIPKFIQGNKLGNSGIYESSGNIGIGTEIPSEKLDVSGSGHFTGDLTVDGTVIGSVAGDADTVNNIHASSSPEANKLLPLDANAKFPALVVSIPQNFLHYGPDTDNSGSYKTIFKGYFRKTSLAENKAHIWAHVYSTSDLVTEHVKINIGGLSITLSRSGHTHKEVLEGDIDISSLTAGQAYMLSIEIRKSGGAGTMTCDFVSIAMN